MRESDRYQAIETQRAKRKLAERADKLRSEWPLLREARTIVRARVAAAIERINARAK